MTINCVNCKDFYPSIKYYNSVLTISYLYLFCLKMQRFSAKFNENELEMEYKG